MVDMYKDRVVSRKEFMLRRGAAEDAVSEKEDFKSGSIYGKVALSMGGALLAAAAVIWTKIKDNVPAYAYQGSDTIPAQYMTHSTGQLWVDMGFIAAGVAGTLLITFGLKKTLGEEGGDSSSAGQT